MRRNFETQKQLILGGLILLLLADVALALYSWQLSSAPHSLQAISQQAHQLELLKADVKRANEIRANIPNMQKDCDQFEHSLFASNSGYSSVTSELGEIARKSGIHLDDLTFKQYQVESRKMAEVVMDATISGDYKSVIEFLNGVQRSKNNYAVDSLTLASENANQGPGGPIKVAVHLRTYFRTAA